MSAVYERARRQGYSKARSAKIGWGAVKRAGYDPDHFDYEIAGLQEIIRSLKAKDKYLDAQAERLGTEYQPVSRTAVELYTGGIRQAKKGAEQVYPLAAGALAGEAAAAPEELGLEELVPLALADPARRGTYAKGSFRKFVARSRPQKFAYGMRQLGKIRGRAPTWEEAQRRYRDPRPRTKPIDLAGYDNTSMVRLVPQDDTPGYYPTRGLVEGQIVQPQHQFIKFLETINGKPEYGHIELTDENGDGYIDRWIARGPKDAKNPTKGNVNMFGDIAKPLKTDRLKVENWSLA